MIPPTLNATVPSRFEEVLGHETAIAWLRGALSSDRLPHAMVFVGKADPRYVGRPRPPIPMNELARFYV